MHKEVSLPKAENDAVPRSERDHLGGSLTAPPFGSLKDPAVDHVLLLFASSEAVISSVDT